MKLHCLLEGLLVAWLGKIDKWIWSWNYFLYGNCTKVCSVYLLYPSSSVTIFNIPNIKQVLITTQKVHFYKLKLNCTKHFWVVVRPLYPIWHVKDLANVTNQFLVSFSVFDSFFITETAQDWGRVWSTWRIRALEHFKTPCQTWKRVAKTISSKMEGNRAFRKAKSSNSQGVPKFARCAKLSQGDYYQKVLFCRPNYNGFKHLWVVIIFI